MMEWKDALDSAESTHLIPSQGGLLQSIRKIHVDERDQSLPEGYGELSFFLSGCYMDAGEFDLARKCLLLCWASLKSAIGEDCTEVASTSFVHLVRECISLLEEDPSEDESCHHSRELIQVTLDTRTAKLPWVSPWQRPGYIHPEVKTKPIYARSEHPNWCSVLESHWEDVRSELENLLPSTRCLNPSSWPLVGSGTHRGGGGSHDGHVVNKNGDWREIVLVAAEGSRPDLAPKTSQLLEEHAHDAVSLARQGGGEIILSVMAPGTHVKSHCGGTNCRLTAHLGLIVPPDGKCRIRVADEWTSWEEGKVLVFDDSFEHEVVNESSTIRVVLLMRFWHTSLKATDREQCLERAMTEKSNDTLRRYNPPLPGFEGSLAIRERAMENSRCRNCHQHGFQSLEVDVSRRTLRCICGAMVSDYS